MTSLLLTTNDDEVDIGSLEFYLLGWILVDSSLIDRLGFLRPEHFYSDEHARIYAKMREMRASGDVITPMSLAQHVDVDGGIVRYLSKAIVHCSAMRSPVEEAKILLELSSRREISALLTAKLAGLASRSPEEAIADITAGLEAIASKGSLVKFMTDKQVSQMVIDRLNSPAKPFSTGIGKLDQAMEGGLFPGMNYLFAARKKVGKTTLASTISCNLNQQNVPHLFICAEMSAVEIHQRILARTTGSFTSSFRSSYGKSPAFQDKIRAQMASSNGCIIFQNAPGITFEDLKSSVSQAISQYKIKGFILDSLQLVGGKSSKKSTAEHMDEVAQWCADYGRKRGVFSIVTAQVNQTGNIRGGEGVRLACDQGYEIHAPGDDPSRSDRWVEMIETRYTPWMNIGSKESPALLMHEHGQYFHELVPGLV